MFLGRLMLVGIILVPVFGFSQTIKFEEFALEYYLENIYEKHIKLKSTGKIETYESRQISMLEYLECKKELTKHFDHLDTAQWDYYLSEWNRVFELGSKNLDTISTYTSIGIKKPIKKVEKVSYKKLRGGPAGWCRDLTSELFGEPFNLHIYKQIEFENFHYVTISVVKKDLEYARDFIFKLDATGVIDFCETGWIQ